MELLHVSALVTGYGGQAVVRGLSLGVAGGEVVALLGPNGAGKTTTINTIAGAISPISGSIVFDGRDIVGVPTFRLARQRMGLMPEGRALFPSLTVREHLRVGRGWSGMGVDDLLDLLPELGQRLGQRAGVLSGGEQQMLALGRALLSGPKLLLVDEMSLGLAPIVVERLLPVVREAALSLGAGVLLVEQHVDLALEVADRAIVLAHGDVVLEGPASALAGDRGAISRSYLGEGSANSI